MTKLVKQKIKLKKKTRRIGIKVVIMKKTVQTRSNRDENASSVQGKWFE